MTNEEKQAALDLCEGNILKLKGAIATFEEISPELDILSKLRSELIIQQAAFAALTAQPVKLPESFYGVIQDGKVVMIPADDGQWLNKTSVAEAYRALGQRAEAGYEVQE